MVVGDRLAAVASRHVGYHAGREAEVIDIAGQGIALEESIARLDAVDDMSVAMQDAGKLGDVSAVLRRGCQVKIVLQDKLCIGTIARSCTSIAY